MRQMLRGCLRMIVSRMSAQLSTDHDTNPGMITQMLFPLDFYIPLSHLAFLLAGGGVRDASICHLAM